jgi:predicted dehydrogenase
MKRFTAAVIGLGKIGQGFDYEIQDGSQIMTHAGGFSHHHGFKLVAAVDADEKQRRLFIEKYRLPAYATTDELYADVQPDVVSIAVPTKLHCDIFRKVALHRPLAVLCEKPIAGSFAEAEKMVALAQQAKIALLVNFIRRFEPGVIELKKAIDEGLFGAIYKGTVWYTKGFLNNGSHFVDLLRFLLGEVDRFSIVSKGGSFNDADPEPDVCVRFGAADIMFLAGRHDCFSMADIELAGTAGLVRYGDGGRIIEYQRVEPDPVYADYFTLAREKSSIQTDLYRYQWHVLDALHRHLTDGVPLASDGGSALATMATVEEICTAL